MKTSEHTDLIDAALLKVQRELATVQRKGTADIERSGVTRTSKYVTAESIYASCHDLLVQHNVTLWQGGERDEKGSERLLTVLASGGQQRVSSFPILCREGTGAQNFGGGLAFAKRWGLQLAVGIFPPEDQDEQHGYSAARAETKAARPSKAPAGIAAALADLRKASTCEMLVQISNVARGAFPTGEGAAQIEKAIAAWLVGAFDDVPNLDALNEVRDCVKRTRCTSNEVREAIGRASRRLGEP